MSRSTPAPDRKRMEKALREFLSAAAVDLADPNMRDTPQRVADAYITEFLSGYQHTADEALGELHPVSQASDREMVVVTDLKFRSMCPHHLMAYSGRAHVAYVPGKAVVGFGRLSKLVDTFANRLILQEELTRAIAVSLFKSLKSQGAACIIEAGHACLRLRGDEQDEAVTHTEAYEGVLKKPALRAELWSRIQQRRPS